MKRGGNDGRRSSADPGEESLAASSLGSAVIIANRDERRRDPRTSSFSRGKKVTLLIDRRNPYTCVRVYGTRIQA